MLANKRDDRGAFPLLKGLMYYRLLKDVTYKGEKVGTNSIMFMVGVMAMCGKTNEFAQMSDVFAILNVAKGGRCEDLVIPPLIRLGLMERPGWGLFVLTNEGEYFLRDIETMFSRITNNTVRSKWRKITEGDKRSKYVRKRRFKGAKIVSVPKDARLKVKHGLPALKANGQPRTVNLPGSPTNTQ